MDWFLLVLLVLNIWSIILCTAVAAVKQSNTMLVLALFSGVCLAISLSRAVA
jgi:hypothetical protein